MMRRSLVVLLGLAAVALGAPGQPAASSCETCHSAAAAGHRGSVHEQAGMSCLDCHGGDPNDFTEAAMAPAAGFRGSPSRTEQPAYCATCHANPTLMRPYGLPTTQYHEYQQSRHGQAIAAGRTKAAVCTDCHGVHDTLPSEDRRSRVSLDHQAETCGRCHADPRVMAGSGLSTDQYVDYVGGVHGRAVLQDHRESAPTCATCHGSHGAAPPALNSVDLVCGRCHRETQTRFAGSVHAAPAAAGSMAPCLSCHRAHGVADATAADIVPSCRNCHADEPALIHEAEALARIVTEAETLYQETAETVASNQGLLPDAAELESELQQARTALTALAVAQHSLRTRDVERQAVVIKAVAEHLEAAREDRRDRFHFRLLVLAYAWLLLSLPIGAMFVWRQQFERARRAAGDQP